MFLDAFTGAFGVLLQPLTWAFIILGALWGVVVGAMPGIGTTLGYALLIPLTFVLDPVVSVAMLLALAVGSQFGNSLPAILVGIPGGSASIMTVLDGHTLYRQGKGDIALGASYIAALGGQVISIPLFVLLVIPLSAFAYAFQPPEMFGIYTLGIVAIVTIVGKNLLKGLLSAGLGFMVSLVGLDPLTSRTRFTFGISELRPGLDEVAVIVGLLAVGEIFRQVRQIYAWSDLEQGARRRRIKLPRLKTMGGRDMVPALLGGTVVGTVVGAIPGAGATSASLISYQQAKLWSKRPEEFGKGSLTGIIANESAQNASNSGELVPTLALGIPPSGSMVILLSALTAQGFVPGPFLIDQDPQLLYAAIGGLLGGTIFLAIIGMRLAGWMLVVSRTDRTMALISALAIVVVGVYALRSSMTDVIVLFAFGVIGYFMYRYDYSPAAAALAVVVGEGFESSLRHGLDLSNQSMVELITRPVTAGLLAVSLVLLVVGIWKESRSGRPKPSARKLAEPKVRG
jgi:putative tricarboxylic transport membrane protein